MSEILAFQAIVIVCATSAFIASLQFLKRYVEVRHERSLRRVPNEVSERIDHMETLLESTALEMERIGEANRFVAKLLAERAAPVAPPIKQERVITPH